MIHLPQKQQNSYEPQESLLDSLEHSKKLSIGIPKENSLFEHRVPLTPLSVELLINNGHQVLIETKAGIGANFPDNEYAEKGAKIVYSTKEVYQTDIIVKIAYPTIDEVQLMKKQQYLISSAQIKDLNMDTINLLIEKKITALSYEMTNDGNSGVSKVVQAMSEITGIESIMIAAEYLGKLHGGKGLMLGSITGVPPSEIVVLGAGIVAENAAKTALALGADVKVFDESLDKLRRLQNNIGQKIYTSIVKTLILEKAIKRCDVVIGAIGSKKGRTPCVISEQLVQSMKPNAIIIDVSITQGGCFETSELTNLKDPAFRKHNIIHYCLPNIPSRVPRTSSYALTNILTPIALQIGQRKPISNIIDENNELKEMLYLYQGQVSNKTIAQKFNLLYKDLSLLSRNYY